MTTILQGYVTYLAAAGLFGLALYQFSVGQTEDAVKTLGQALVAAGLRRAIGSSAQSPPAP